MTFGLWDGGRTCVLKEGRLKEARKTEDGREFHRREVEGKKPSVNCQRMEVDIVRGRLATYSFSLHYAMAQIIMQIKCRFIYLQNTGFTHLLC